MNEPTKGSDMKKLGAVGVVALAAGLAIGQKTAPSPLTLKVASFSCVADITPDNALTHGQPRREGCSVQFHLINGVRLIQGQEFPNIIGKQALTLDRNGTVLGDEKAEVPKEVRDMVRSFFGGKLEPLKVHAK